MADLNHSFDHFAFTSEEKEQLTDRLKQAAEQEERMKEPTKRIIRHTGHRLLIGAGAAAALVWGLCTAFRPRVPLYYKIVFFGMASCFLGSCYEALARLLEPSAAEGFHVGYFGYIGLFFFLYSSYYGAINSLADGGGREFRRFRLIAGLAAALAVKRGKTLHDLEVGTLQDMLANSGIILHLTEAMRLENKTKRQYVNDALGDQNIVSESVILRESHH